MWLYLHRRRIDFVAGEQVRAPAFMQRTGTEWLWRLATNPRRLAVRYASCAVILAESALIRPLRKRASRFKLSAAA